MVAAFLTRENYLSDSTKRTSLSVTEDVLDLLKQVRVEIFAATAQAAQEYEGQMLIMEEPSLNMTVKTLCLYWQYMHRVTKKGKK